LEGFQSYKHFENPTSEHLYIRFAGLLEKKARKRSDERKIGAQLS